MSNTPSVSAARSTGTEAKEGSESERRLAMTPAFPRFTHAARDVDNQTVIQRSGRGARTEGDPLEMTGRGQWGGPPRLRINIHAVTPSLVLFRLLALIKRAPPFVWADRSDLTSKIH